MKTIYLRFPDGTSSVIRSDDKLPAIKETRRALGTDLRTARDLVYGVLLGKENQLSPYVVGPDDPHKNTLVNRDILLGEKKRLLGRLAEIEADILRHEIRSVLRESN